MSRYRVVLALLVVGLVLLPGPAYAIWLDQLDGPDRHRSSAGYVAEPIDVGNDSLVTDRYAVHLTFRPEGMEYRHVADDYRAPNRTRRVLERSIRNGTATTDDPSVRGDLRRLERNYTYLALSYDVYYAYSVSTSATATTVETTRANDSEIAAAVREELVVPYGDLSTAEQRTFRKIRNATTSDDEYAYRPWSDEPVPGAEIVERDGTHYDLRVASNTDDFDFPDGLFLGIVASLVGIVSLLASGGVWLYGRVVDE